MFIINQSGQWAVNSAQVVRFKQAPHDNNKCTAIRAETANNEFTLATYADPEYADKVFSELVSSCIISGSDTYMMCEDKG